YEARTAAVKEVVDGWRATDRLQPLRGQWMWPYGWRDELYPLYTGEKEAALSIERSAAALFGMAAFGVHINIITATSSTGALAASGLPGMDNWKMWIARRSLHKPTYPGMLDNSVAGGIPYGLSPRETMIKECEEEASLPAHLAEKAVCTGYVSHINDTADGVQPEVQYVYDLLVPPSTTLRPNDGEVECFYLWDAMELRTALLSGAFKPNCALVILDFLLRHGLITPESDPAYLSLASRLH
ncbi:NUDIX hydrolase domain-like protein, partial [Piptocephalis cylindrospora]